MNQNTTYLKFTNSNDHEGETWHFFVPQDMQYAQELKSAVDKYTELAGDECNPETSYEEVDEKTMQVLLKKKSATYYMNEYNLVKSINSPKQVDKSLPNFEKMNLEQLEEYFYKGKPFNY